MLLGLLQAMTLGFWGCKSLQTSDVKDVVESDPSRYRNFVIYSKLIDNEPMAILRHCSPDLKESQLNRSCPTTVNEDKMTLTEYENRLKQQGTPADWIELILSYLRSNTVAAMTDYPQFSSYVYNPFGIKLPYLPSGAAGGGSQSTSTLSCNVEPGRNICTSLQSLYSTLTMTCTGDACPQIWQSQMSALDNFRITYNNNFPANAMVSNDMSQLALNSLNIICASVVTGPRRWMDKLHTAKANAYNGLSTILAANGFGFRVNDCPMTHNYND